MADEDNAFVGYIALEKKAKDKLGRSYRFSGNLDELRSKILEPDKPVVEQSSPDIITSESSSHSEKLSNLLKKSSELSALLRNLAKAITFSSKFHTDAICQFAIVEPILKTGTPVEEIDKFEIYGVESAQMQSLVRANRDLHRTQKAYDILPHSIFLSMTAQFDSFLGEMVETMLAIRPEKIDLSSKTVLISEVLSSGSLEDFRRKVLDDELYNFSRSSHEEQVRYIEKVFGVSIIQSWKRWPDFVELFERRNLVAHGIQTFSSRYVSICETAGHKGSSQLLGENVEVRTKYILQSLDLLFEFIGLSIFTIWMKILKEEKDEALSQINEFCYKCLDDESYAVPIRIIEHIRSLKSLQIKRSTELMLIVNLASGYKHLNQPEQCKNVLDEVDWSAASDNYRICVAALSDDVEEVIRLLPIVKAVSSIDKDDFRTWPVFDSVRENKAFLDCFRANYGENLIHPKLTREGRSSDDLPAETKVTSATEQAAIENASTETKH